MFGVEEFVASCRGCIKENTPQIAVKELLQRTMSRPADIEAALGTPTKAEVATLSVRLLPIEDNRKALLNGLLSLTAPVRNASV